MVTGTQFTGTLAPHETHQWFTFNWDAAAYMVWTVMPTTTQNVAELSWTVSVQRTDATHCTFWITVMNLTAASVSFEARYAILS
jgi:hypothetical protein